MAGEIQPNYNSQYSSQKGKTNVVMQGQTDSGAYGSSIDAKRRVPDPPSEESV